MEHGNAPAAGQQSDEWTKVKRALDIAEGRLLTLDNMRHPAIPPNEDVLAILRDALAAHLASRAILPAACAEQGEATTEQLLELAGALEQRRALAIVEKVTVLSSNLYEGPFRAGYETACEEVTTRLRTEQTDGDGNG